MARAGQMLDEVLAAEGRRPSRRRTLLLVALLSVPAILAEISTTLMQYIDAAMVGGLGAQATAAIGLVETTTWLFGGVALCVGAGFTVQVAQLVGARREADARNVLRQALVCTLVAGLVLATIGVAISGQLPRWMGGDPALCPDASAYFRICAVSMLPVTIVRLCVGMLQCAGDMLTPSVLNVVACVLDVCFNALLIRHETVLSVAGLTLVLPGAGLGVAGAALGTLAAQVMTALLLLWCTCVRSERLRLRERGAWVPRRHVLGNAARVAGPLLVQRLVESGAWVAGTLIVAPLGVVAVAANSLAVTAEALCYMPGEGVSAAATTLVGQAVGANRRDLARSFARASTLTGMAVMGLAAAVMWVAAPQIMGMLTVDSQVTELGIRVLRIAAFSEPLFAAAMVVAGALRGAGDTLVPSLLNLGCMWGVRIPLGLLLAPVYGLCGVWAVNCGELCLRGMLFLVRLLRDRWLDHASLT